MHVRRWILVGSLTICLLAGCGGGRSSMMSMGSATPVPVSGNWTFGPAIGGTTSLPSIPPFLGGSLTVTGTQVSADLLAILTSATACTATFSPDMTLSGTVQSAQMKLTSTTWYGSVVTITGTVSTNGQSISGSWSAKGGCADGQSGTFAASYVQPFTGTWTGTASNLPAGLTGATTNSPLAGANLTFQLQQSSTPQQFLFPFSGSMTVSGTNCGFTQGTLVPSESGFGSGSGAVGNTLLIEATMDDGKSVLIVTGVPTPQNPSQWLVILEVVGGACNLASAQATLAKQ